mmetsp:Transcript_117933/g.334421  ORF Transcript_117933/g.334421 Transcript_117933/m.334421 type:complete len:256 (+) Transcript_117933:56-823(+)
MFGGAQTWIGSYLASVLLPSQGCCCTTELCDTETKEGGDLVMVTSCFDEKTDDIVFEQHLGGGPPKAPTVTGALRGCGPRQRHRGGRAAEGAGGGGEGDGPRHDRSRPSAAVLLEPCRCTTDADVDDEISTAAVQEQLMLRELLKGFVQDMLRGKGFLVVVGNGGTQPCRLSLTSSLMCFQLSVGGSNHEIPLRSIKDVCPGELTGHGDAPVHLDELCNTLVLKNHECISFKFGTVQERDDFTKCVKVLAIALDV